MELFYVLAIWIGSLYMIRLYRELSLYRKYLNQHNDIYVPSYSELIETNHFKMKLSRLIHQHLKKNISERTKETVSVYNSKQFLSGSVFSNSAYSKE